MGMAPGAMAFAATAAAAASVAAMGPVVGTPFCGTLAVAPTPPGVAYVAEGRLSVGGDCCGCGMLTEDTALGGTGIFPPCW